MAWRLAKSLTTLRAEVNAWAPNRSKRSDGTLGDPAHAARASRHNPNRYGVVTALDLTHDPAGGCDIHALARRLVQDPHPELEYVISNRQVASRTRGWVWRHYTGTNPHTLHAHFAVGRGPDSAPAPPYDSTQPWGVIPVQAAAATVTPTPAPPEEEDHDMDLSRAEIVRADDSGHWYVTDCVTRQWIRGREHAALLVQRGAKIEAGTGKIDKASLDAMRPYVWPAAAVTSIRLVGDAPQ